MTVWGFVFIALIVFVVFYAWYKFVYRNDMSDAAHLDRDKNQVHMRGTKRVRPTSNQPLMTETGLIGEREDRPEHHKRSAETQKYLTEVGMVGDVMRRPIAGYLPAPKQEFSTETGTIGEVQNPASHDNEENLSQSQLNPNHQETLQNAVASENVGSNMRQTQLNPNQAETAWVENSDLERLNNQSNQSQSTQQSAMHTNAANMKSQGYNQLAQANQQTTAYKSTVSGQPIGQSQQTGQPQSYQQASQAYSTEAGLIGKTGNLDPFVHQGPRNSMRRNYVNKSDVEIGNMGTNDGLSTLPDQLPVLNNQTFNDPKCK